jgi:hypothetical protein
LAEVVSVSFEEEERRALRGEVLLSEKSRGTSSSLPLSSSSSTTLRGSFSDCDRNRTRTRFFAYSGRGASVSEPGEEEEGGACCVEEGGGANGDSHPSGDSIDGTTGRSEWRRGAWVVRGREDLCTSLLVDRDVEQRHLELHTAHGIVLVRSVRDLGMLASTLFGKNPKIRVKDLLFLLNDARVISAPSEFLWRQSWCRSFSFLRSCLQRILKVTMERERGGGVEERKAYSLDRLGA